MPQITVTSVIILMICKKKKKSRKTLVAALPRLTVSATVRSLREPVTLVEK